MIFHYFYDKIKIKEENGFDSSYVNFAKFLINANIDNLMKLEKYNKNKLDLENFKKEFIEEKKRKKGKLYREILKEKEDNNSKEDEDMNSDNDSDLDMFTGKYEKNKSSKIQKIDFDSDDSHQNYSSSDWGNSIEESFENDNSDNNELSDTEDLKTKKRRNKKSFYLDIKGVKNNFN